jgi:glucose-6-phosphate 1-dehydrogenase
MAHSFVIFGASGDLTSRKLIPALYQLHRKKRLPEGTQVVGFSRTHYSHDQWRAELRESTQSHLGVAFDADEWDRFAQTIFYHPGDLTQKDDVIGLKVFLDDRESDAECTRVYYLATAPRFYESAIEQLGASGLAEESCGQRRVVIEKPFGTDLATAEHLNAVVHRVFAEQQVYRIDHYLGKETVQNLLVFRFANSIFEPVWNRNYIDHVQITVAEEVTVGSRAGYYDTAGVMRDMFQNHLLQLMMITAMEAPARYTADIVRDEKVKVLRSIRPLSGKEVDDATIRAQYDGYRDEPDVADGSETATFAAARLWVDSWRWQGVPFYLRSGKGMSCRTTQIVVQFRKPPQQLFDVNNRGLEGNRLVIQVQPAEGIQLHIQTKVPDAGMSLRQTDLDFRFQQEFRTTLPEAYERLLLDAMQGDASLFARADEVELAWRIVDPILAAWRDRGLPKLARYAPGGWGPDTCGAWMQAQGRLWFDACPVLH